MRGTDSNIRSHIDVPQLVALVDRIADLAERLARTITQLAEMGVVRAPAVASALGSRRELDSDPANYRNAEHSAGLWSTRRVAAHYDVTTSFVYQHADELGCIRLGGGRCARLRFDPEVVCARWPTLGDLPESRPSRRPRSASGRRTVSGQGGEHTLELLDFDRDP